MADTSVLEGDVGVTQADFGLTLSHAASGPVTVRYHKTVASDPAAAYPADLADFSGSLVIPAGQLSATIPLRIAGDTIDEFDEGFRVEIDTEDATVERRWAIGTIVDDDPQPTISIADARGTERAGPMTFVVSLSTPGEKPWSFVWISADGTARNAVDFNAAGERVDGAAGTVRARFTVPLLNDHVPEQTEKFTMRLIAIEGADPGDIRANATIVDDDVLAQETGVTRVGSWQTVALVGASKDQVAKSSAADAFAKYTFTGDYVAWIGTRGAGYGKAKVIVDGNAVIVDLFAPQHATQATLFEQAFPEAGRHTIRIVVLGTKNPAATAKRVDLDAILYEK